LAKYKSAKLKYVKNFFICIACPKIWDSFANA